MSVAWTADMCGSVHGTASLLKGALPLAGSTPRETLLDQLGSNAAAWGSKLLGGVTACCNGLGSDDSCCSTALGTW